MKTIEYAYRDKSDWGQGAWQNEPDKIQYPDEETLLPCLIVRGPSGALCGYVGVDEKHPFFEIDYDALQEYPEVHGGLTFSRFCDPGESDETVCHIPEEGEAERVWWFGFDCAHLGDASPAHHERFGGLSLGVLYGDTYRTIAYVKGEIAGLAAWLTKEGVPVE